jgi:hypothetical protein
MKNYNDTIRDRTRDRPACGAMSQPPAPPQTPTQHGNPQHSRQYLALRQAHLSEIQPETKSTLMTETQ